MMEWLTFGRVTGFALIGVLGLWFVANVAFLRQASVLFQGAALALVGVCVVLLWRRGVSIPTALSSSLTLGILAFMFVPANNRGPWASRQSEHPVSVVDGNARSIFGFRTVAPEGKVEYGLRTLPPEQLERLWFGMEAFSGWEGIAHTWLTFGLKDGSKVTVSVESRRAEDEPFSAMRGLFRAYELVYLIGDQRELIGKRVRHATASVREYPVRATPEQIKELFASILRRSEQLSQAPEHYNTLTNNCTTNLAGHVHAISPETLPWFDLRIVFPGYADQLLYELGLLDTDLPFEEARRQFQVH